MPPKATHPHPSTLLSKCCSMVPPPHPPQGHAIQSDWRHDEELAELMGSTCLLFIMARRGSRRKWTSLLADAFISKWGDVSCKIQIITKLINLEFMNTGILSIQWNPEWLMFTTNWKDFWQRTLLLNEAACSIPQTAPDMYSAQTCFPFSRYWQSLIPTLVLD